METRTADLGTKEDLTQSSIAGFDAQAVRLLLSEMYRALVMCGCWCTEVVWYSKAAASKCSRCKAKERYEAMLL